MGEIEQKQFSVVVAEDESRILKNILSLVEESGLGFRVAAIACDGRAAMDLVEKLRPHLLITDIRMPKATGLEILKFIRENRIPTLSLIISSFDYFQYAQEALHYGAREYLLKPVTRAQMEHSLAEILALLDSNEIEDTFSLDMALAGFPQRLPHGFSGYLLILAHCGNVMFCGDEKGAAFPEWALRLLAAEARLMAPPLRGARLWLSTGQENRCRCLLLGYTASFKAEEYAQGLYEKLIAASGGEPVSLWTAALNGTGGIKALADSLYQQMRKGSVFGNSIYCHSGRGPAGFSLQELFNKYALYAEKLPQALQNREIPQLKLILKDMVRYWKESGCPSEIMLNIIKYQYLNAGKILNAPLRLEWENNLEKIFSFSKDWEELYEGLEKYFSGLISDQKTMERAEDMMRLIDQYICENYAKHITNQTLSRHFGFVPSYISKLFRDYKGISPCEYLTRIRIERALKLIGDSRNSNVYDIARAVGFQDPSYFSRLFKRQTGMLPTEYRQMP